MDKKNVGQLQENSGSAIKKLREEQRYLIQKESTAISFSGKRYGFKEKRRNWLKYKYICNSLICKANYRLIIALIIVSSLIGFFLFLIS